MQTPMLLPAHEWTEIEVFIPCDPFAFADEEPAEPEMLALFAGALLGSLGFEHLHDVIEGLDHLGAIQDGVRSQISPQALRDAMAAFRRQPVPCAPGAVQGVWIRVPVRRAALRQVIAHTAPSQQIPAPRAVVAPQAVCAWRPRLRPSWAR